MRISKELNLVVPVEVGDDTFYVHSSPIRSEVFKQYFLVLSKTLNALYAEGISQVTGPRVAALMLQDIAKEGDPEEIPSGWLGNSKSWSGKHGVENGLMAEIRRLSNVIMPTPDGWKNIPIGDALKQGLLTEQEVQEVEGFIVFFTCVWHIHKRNEVSTFLAHLGKVWDTQTTSSSCTEFRDSLPRSTETETFAPTVKQSLVPG